MSRCPSFPRPRVITLLLAAAMAGVLALAAPAPASAATAVVPNACRYSIDNLYRDMPLEITTTAAVLPDARYPTPGDVVAGQTVRSSAGTFDVELPQYLAPFGYALGLLRPGANTVQAKVWVAVRGTNTRERVRVVGPVDISATTTISVDPADDNRFSSATPWSYAAPTLPSFDWLAVGGDVNIGQAGPGTLPALPVGPGGTSRPIAGSAVIQLLFSTGASLYLDCQPGVTTGLQYDFAGTGFAAAAAAPAAAIAGPQNLMCLNDAGRQAAGAQVNLPSGITRELDPLRAALSAPGAAPTFTPGVPWTLPAGRLTAVVSADSVATLGRMPDGGGAIVTPGAAYPVSGWVTLTATNTAEGSRTVPVTSTWSPAPAVTPVTGSSPWLASEVAFDVPATTWTPTGAGPVVVTLGGPGTMTPIQVTGPATGGPGGPVVGSTFTAAPYGALVLRLGTEANPAALDCVTGAVAIADDGVAWSNAGRGAPPAGSAGRYAIDANLDTPAVAVATAPVAPAPAQPAPVAPVARPVASPGRLAVARLKLTGRRVAVTLSCPARGVACRGVLRIRTASKLKVGRRKAAVLTVVAARRYAVPAGRRLVLRLPVKPAVRTLLKRRPAVRVVVSLDPARGRTLSRAVPLRR